MSISIKNIYTKACAIGIYSGLLTKIIQADVILPIFRCL